MIRGRGSRRTTRWVTYQNGGNALVNGTPEFATMLAAGSTVVGATILRIVGNIAFHGTTVDTAQSYASGILVAPNSMDAIDMDASLATDLDWMYWQQRGTNNAAYDGVDSFVLDRHTVDVRGRRKIDEGESLFYCETHVGAGANSYVNLRILILNP